MHFFDFQIRTWHLDETHAQVMVKTFNDDELTILCAEVQKDLVEDGITVTVNLEMVEGDTKERQILELIDYFDRRGMLPYLVEAAFKTRPLKIKHFH